MAAPTSGWENGGTVVRGAITPPALFGERTIDAGEVLTIDLLNVSELVELENTGAVALKVGVLDDVSLGVQGDAYRLLPAGAARSFKWSAAKIVVLNDTLTDGAKVTGSATLTSLPASEVTLDDDNGFDAVESVSATRFAVAVKAS